MGKRIAVVLVALVALAACGSSGGAASSKSGSGDHSSGNDDFSSLLQQAKQASYKVTYSGGSGGPFTIAQDPPRFAFTEGDSSTFVTAAGAAVSCSGSGSSATCTQIPGSGSAIQQGMSTAFGAIGSALVAATTAGVPGLANLTTKSGQKIAGRDATCATIDKNSLGVLGAAIDSKASYTVCVDKSTGVLLSSKSDDGNGNVSSITATDFGTPTDADFTPPSTPVTVPGLTPST